MKFSDGLRTLPTGLSVLVLRIHSFVFGYKCLVSIIIKDAGTAGPVRASLFVIPFTRLKLARLKGICNFRDDLSRVRQIKTDFAIS